MSVQKQVEATERELRRLRRETLKDQTKGTNLNFEEAEVSMENQVEQDLPICEYAAHRRVGDLSCIRRPPIQAQNFEIKNTTMTMLNSIPFCGLSLEDPNLHVSQFLEICDMSKYHGVTEDALKLRLFPWTLKDKAKAWLLSLPAGTITTWAELEEKFLNKFFPPAKTAKLKNDIINFNQWDQESLYEAWERFKESLRKCPNHQLLIWVQVQTFYNGLDYSTKQMLDAAAGGSLMRKRQQEAYDLIEDMATNTYQYPNERRNSTRRDTKAIQEVDVGGLSNQIASQVLKTIEHKFGQKGVHSIQSSNFDLFCDLCGSNEHMSNDCQNGNSLNCDGVNFVGNFQGRQQNNPFSNTYNPGWRNHLNISWANNQNFQGQEARQGGGNNGAMQQSQQF